MTSADARHATRRSSSRRNHRVAHGIVIALVVLLALLAATLAVGSLASYESVKSHLDAFASDRDADVTRTEYDAIVLRLRLAAALAAAGAIGTLLGRRRLGDLLAELGSASVIAAGSLSRGLRREVAHESWLHLGTLGVLTATALAVRLSFLFQPMRYDESVTYVHYASRPWYIALTNYTAPNNHVFHSLLAHVSTLVFGGAPWAIRLPALVAGVLLVPASYVAGRAFYGRTAALLTASLVASSSMLIEYSTNARGYTLLALIFMTLLALSTRLRTSWNAAEWLAFAVLASIGFYTVPVMVYAFGSVVVWLALSLWRSGQSGLLLRRLVPSVLVAGALTVLLYLPIVATSGLDSLVRNEFVTSRSWAFFTAELPDSVVSVGEGWHRDIPAPLAAAIALAFLVGLVLHRRVSPVWPAPAAAAVLFIAPVLAAQRVVPFDRVWLFLLPLYLMTASAGIAFVLQALARRRTEVLTVALGVLMSGLLAVNAVASQAVYDSEQTSTFRDGDNVAGFLAARLEEGDKLLVAPPADAILEYHLARRGLEPAELLYWDDPGQTRRFYAVVKEGPNDYPLEHLRADPRLRGTSLGRPRLLRRYDEASVYELPAS